MLTRFARARQTLSCLLGPSLGRLSNVEGRRCTFLCASISTGANRRPGSAVSRALQIMHCSFRLRRTLVTQHSRNYPLSDQHSFAADKHSRAPDRGQLANHRLRLRRTSGRRQAICQKSLAPGLCLVSAISAPQSGIDFLLAYLYSVTPCGLGHC
jgi:hypothetical protein